MVKDGCWKHLSSLPWLWGSKDSHAYLSRVWACSGRSFWGGGCTGNTAFVSNYRVATDQLSTMWNSLLMQRLLGAAAVEVFLLLMLSNDCCASCSSFEGTLGHITYLHTFRVLHYQNKTSKKLWPSYIFNLFKSKERWIPLLVIQVKLHYIHYWSSKRFPNLKIRTRPPDLNTTLYVIFIRFQKLLSKVCYSFIHATINWIEGREKFFLCQARF